MILREILKNVRPIEIRMNRTVTELAGERARPGRSQRRPRRWLRVARVQTDTPAVQRNVRREGAPNRSRGGCAPRNLFQTAAQFGRIPRAVEHSENSQGVIFDCKVNKFSASRRLENERKAHFQPKRLLKSASTCSQGIPSWGFFSKSARRRSSSAACSAVRSGSYPFSMMFVQTCWASARRSRRPNFASISIFNVFHGNLPLGIGGAFQIWKQSMNSSQRRCDSSTRSSNGSFFAAEKNFFTVMDLFYSGSCSEQFEIRHSSFPHDPRRNPKKTRQIEILTNRLESETPVYFSFQPLAQFLWISCGVANRNDADVLRLNVHVDAT